MASSLEIQLSCRQSSHLMKRAELVLVMVNIVHTDQDSTSVGETESNGEPQSSSCLGIFDRCSRDASRFFSLISVKSRTSTTGALIHSLAKDSATTVCDHAWCTRGAAVWISESHHDEPTSFAWGVAAMAMRSFSNLQITRMELSLPSPKHLPLPPPSISPHTLESFR